MCGDPRGDAAVMEPLFAPEQGPETGHLFRRRDVKGYRSPVHVRQAVSGHVSVHRIEVLRKMVPHPEFRHEMVPDLSGQEFIPAGGGVVPGDPVESGGAPERVNGVTLRHAVTLEPGGALDVIPASPDRTGVGGHGGQVVGGEID